MKDLKNKFYRTLNLDKEGKLALKWFREHVRSIKNESESNKTGNKEDKRND